MNYKKAIKRQAHEIVFHPALSASINSKETGSRDFFPSWVKVTSRFSLLPLSAPFAVKGQSHVKTKKIGGVVAQEEWYLRRCGGSVAGGVVAQLAEVEGSDGGGVVAQLMEVWGLSSGGVVAQLVSLPL